MNYPQSLDYLESLVRLGIKAGLERTRKLASAMGDPQNRYPSILVAGTNGKGSVSAFLESILRKAGFRTGLYVSPHLVDVRERISAGGGLIAREDFAARMTAVRQAAERVKGRPTFFEVLTLAAFDHFAQAGVDAAVLEVGLGGRLDCTNIVGPRLSVVTNIGLDHQEWLGPDLPSIAREKAGIFRRGIPALTGSRRPVVVETLRREALRLGTPLRFRDEMSLEPTRDGWTLNCPEGSLRLPPAPLAGRHQLENAALAVRAALVLREQGWEIPDSALIRGVAETRWPGRLQQVLQSPAT
ncbi:MAG: Mur ligase family protein, partial [Acidobacteriota bacterium]